MTMCGLGLGFGLFFVGFVTVGAEWFYMWGTENFNGQIKVRNLNRDSAAAFLWGTSFSRTPLTCWSSSHGLFLLLLRFGLTFGENCWQNHDKSTIQAFHWSTIILIAMLLQPAP